MIKSFLGSNTTNFTLREYYRGSVYRSIWYGWTSSITSTTTIGKVNIIDTTVLIINNYIDY